MRKRRPGTRSGHTASVPARGFMAACIIAASLGLLLPGRGKGDVVPVATAASSRLEIGLFHRAATTSWRERGKLVVLYIGAEYCPFCAAERWALVLATSRFGRWSGLGTAHSASGEGGFPPLATYNLLQATYQSAALTVQTREVADLAGKPLQHLTDQQGHALDLYDRQGSIPFVLLGGEYAQTGAGYSPGLLQGLSFARVHQLVYDQPASTVGRAVGREANVITALLCAALGAGARSAPACHLPAVRVLLGQAGR